MHQKLSAHQVKTRYWHTIIGQDQNVRVQCDVCPRYCRLQEGQRGFCFIRSNQRQSIVLDSYALSSGFAIDPIEKKPLYHFYPGSRVLSFGTAGCNLGCKFCQNWDISTSKEMRRLSVVAKPEQIAHTARREGCLSVAYTYNDPVIFHEYAIDTAQACHEQGILSVAVTAGYQCAEPRVEFYRYMDAANIDLKSFTPEFYKKLTGSRLEPVLETIEYVAHETDTWLELTCLLIPGYNDSETEIRQLCEWVAQHAGVYVPLHFSAFHPRHKMRNTPATTLATLRRARELALEQGLYHVYCGNVRDSESATTYCHRCGQVLIQRNGYQCIPEKLRDNQYCPNCHYRLHGKFFSG